jgi:aryl-alcohol dehydrogenase-like predicted oxidoreductase
MMEYRRLGNSGLKVSAVGLGGNNFGWWADEQTSIPVIHHAIDAGINFLDTADVYARGQSEEFIGKAIKGKRANLIIATKFANQMGDDPNERGGSRRYIMEAVDASLKRLKTDYIDLYQMHVPDPTTPMGETLRALDDLIRAGKVRYIGCSNFAAWQMCEAIWISRTNNFSTFISTQPMYNLLSRGIERELVPCCQHYGIGIIPYSPLASGFLTGKYRQGEAPPEGARLSGSDPRFQRVFNEDNWSKLAKLESWAKEHDHTVGELAIAWLLVKPMVSTVIAGARKSEQVDTNVAAGDWQLTPEEVTEVEALLQ